MKRAAQWVKECMAANTEEPGETVVDKTDIPLIEETVGDLLIDGTGTPTAHELDVTSVVNIVSPIIEEVETSTVNETTPSATGENGASSTEQTSIPVSAETDTLEESNAQLGVRGGFVVPSSTPLSRQLCGTERAEKEKQNGRHKIVRLLKMFSKISKEEAGALAGVPPDEETILSLGGFEVGFGQSSRLVYRGDRIDGMSVLNRFFGELFDAFDH